MKATEQQKRTTSVQTAGPEGTVSGGVFHPWQILVRRRWQLLTCLMLVCSVAFAATAFRKPKYQATARVQVVLDQPQMGGLSAALRGSGDYYSTQCQLLQSRHVLARAAQKLNMSDGHWAYSDEGLKDLRESLKVEPVPGSRLIDITGIADTGAKAAAIANQITAAFIETSTEGRKGTSVQIGKRVDEQIAGYDEEIKAAEEKINQFRQDNLITGSDSTLAAIETRIGALESQLTQTQIKRLGLESKREHLARILNGDEEVAQNEVALTEIGVNPTVSGLRQSIDKLRQDEAQLAQAYLPGHQKLRDIRVQIGDLQKMQEEEEQKALAQLHAKVLQDYAATASEEKSLASLLDEQRGLGVKLTAQNQEYRESLSDLEMARKFKTECIAKLRQFKLEEGMSESPVVVVDAAHVPSLPAGLSKPRQVASILLLGLLFSVAFVFAWERLTAPAEAPTGLRAGTTLYVPVGGPGVAYAPMVSGGTSWPGVMWPAGAGAEVSASAAGRSRKTGTEVSGLRNSAVLGRLDRIDLGGNSYDDAAFAARCRIVHTDQRSRQAEAFREVGTKLLSRFGRTQQGMVVTSSSRQSGKTTCASNVALVLAQTGRKVLLVDANEENPALHRVFAGSSGKPGLNEVLFDLAVLDEAVQATNVPALSVLHATTDAGSSEECDAITVERLYHELRQRFDWVIFDSGIMSRKMTKLLLQAVGKALCVTNGTNSDDEMAMAAQIELCGAMNLGFVENRHTTDSMALQQA